MRQHDLIAPSNLATPCVMEIPHETVALQGGVVLPDPPTLQPGDPGPDNRDNPDLASRDYFLWVICLLLS
jgi:hypothetical protein